MKKILLVILSLLFISGCFINDDVISNINAKNDSNNNKEEVKIWDIKPIYVFDDIEVPFTVLNNAYAYFSHDQCLYNGHEVYDYYEEGGLLVKKNNKYGIINGNGEVIVPIKYAEFHKTGLFGEPMFLHDEITWTAQNITKNYSLVDSGVDGWGVGGAVIFPCGISYDGKPIAYDYESFYNPFDRAIKNNYIEKDDYILMCTKWNGFMNCDEKEVYKVIDKYTSGYILANNDGYTILEYDENDYIVKGFSDNVLMLNPVKNKTSNNNDYLFYVDINGNKIGSEYDDGYGFYEGYAPVCKDTKWGYIDKQGNTVVDFIFDKATQISNGKAWVTYKGKTGRLNIANIISSELSLNDDTLEINNYEVLPQIRIKADNIKIRTIPSVSGEHIGKVEKDLIFIYLDKKVQEDYTWYMIAKDMWIADSNGEWIEEIN